MQTVKIVFTAMLTLPILFLSLRLISNVIDEQLAKHGKDGD